MERLQAAINKARQTRDGSRAPVGHPRRRPGVDDKVLQAWEELPELALDIRHLARHRVVTPEAGAVALPFDMLRTRTMRQLQTNGWKRLAITSPRPGCGKSTLALNLAFALARQRQLRTIVVEVDMRRPSLARLLHRPPGGAPRSVGDLLSGGAAFREVAVRHRGNVAFATSPGPVRNSADILLGEPVEEVLREIEDSYRPDIVLFDMPPLLATDDTLAFMQHMDCALIVASAGRSSLQEIDRCEREIAAQTEVLGVALNKCRYGGQSAERYEDG